MINKICDNNYLLINYNSSFTKIMFSKILSRFLGDHLNCTVSKQAVDGAESVVNV